MPPKKKAAPTPAAMRKGQAKVEKPTNPLYEKKPKVFGTGQALPPRKPLNRYVKWPRYVRIQRQRRVLLQRLKVPPALNQFNNTLDKNYSENLFKLLNKYRPETKQEKHERLVSKAEAEAKDGKAAAGKKPIVVKFGVNHVTELIEQNKAQLVVIAHDVNPVELVVWMPALCRKMNVPYCIVKGKARLGSVVHQKTATCLALTAVKNEDKHDLTKLLGAIKSNFADRYDELRRSWGGGVMGPKSRARTIKKQKIIDREAAKRAATA